MGWFGRNTERNALDVEKHQDEKIEEINIDPAPEISEPVKTILELIVLEPERFDLKFSYDGFYQTCDVSDIATGAIFDVSKKSYMGLVSDPDRYDSSTGWINDNEAKALYAACLKILDARLKKEEATKKSANELERMRICALYGITAQQTPDTQH